MKIKTVDLELKPNREMFVLYVEITIDSTLLWYIMNKITMEI